MRKFLGRLFIPVLAAGMLVFAVIHVVRAQQAPPKPPPPVEPARTPFGKTVAGAGIVEPANEASGTSAVSVGSQVAGLVVRVPVKIGQEVKAGDLLVELDKRQAEAQLKVNQAQVAVARATERQTEDTYRRDLAASREAVSDQQRVSDEEAWRLAQAQRQVAEVTVQQAQTALDLLEIRAPSAGTILQVNVRPGEYISVLGGTGLILMGNLHPLHVRVDIDEHDAPRFHPGAPARASLRGKPEVQYPLRFVRVEPYVVPKKSLTGDNTERVDTRVLEVIYALDAKDQPVFVGQQMDVFIDAGDTDSSAGG
jgi:HlyD family secretion protein